MGHGPYLAIAFTNQVLLGHNQPSLCFLPPCSSRIVSGRQVDDEAHAATELEVLTSDLHRNDFKIHGMVHTFHSSKLIHLLSPSCACLQRA